MAVAASASFWFLQQSNFSSQPARNDLAPARPALPPSTAARPASLDGLFAALGAKPADTPTGASALAAQQARFQLLGILAVGQSRGSGHSGGAALLSLDNQPAKPYRIGAAIEEGLEVTALTPRTVSIGSKGTAAFTLELPVKN